jgi:hypothetical protein
MGGSKIEYGFIKQVLTQIPQLADNNLRKKVIYFNNMLYFISTHLVFSMDA